jgi:hypothetical protein
MGSSWPITPLELFGLPHRRHRSFKLCVRACAHVRVVRMRAIMQVGSNVFDIWLGLGLPWLVYLPFQDGGKLIINVDRLDTEIIILAGVLLTYIGTIVCSGFTLTVKVHTHTPHGTHGRFAV